MKTVLKIFFCLVSFISISQTPPYVPANGLVGWWPFNGNANDESGNGNNGAVNGATLTQNRFGNPNSAYSFDGIDDFISMNSSPFVEGPFSVSGWIICVDITAPINPIIGLGELGGSTFNRCYLTPNYGASGRPGIGRGGANDITSTEDVVTSGSWHHVVLVFDSYTVNNVKFYVDGVLLGSNTNGGTTNPFPLNNSGFTVGLHTGSGPRYANADIDDIGLWNRALTQCEITKLYTAGLMTEVSQNGAQLTANQTGATYQWLDCDNSYSIINGEINQSYTPVTTGNYAVEVTMNGCSDTSECFLVDYTGISEEQSERLNVYPNPASDKLTVSFGLSLIENSNYQIVNIYGQVISEAKLQEGVIDISQLPSGVYFLNIVNNDGLEALKFVKK